MSYLLDVKEILEFAVYIEERGYEFYVGAMKKFSEARITELFQYLADEEFKHKEFFKKLLEQSGGIKGESRDPEYQAYMREFCKAHSPGRPRGDRNQARQSVRPGRGPGHGHGL